MECREEECKGICRQERREGEGGRRKDRHGKKREGGEKKEKWGGKQGCYEAKKGGGDKEKEGEIL